MSLLHLRTLLLLLVFFLGSAAEVLGAFLFLGCLVFFVTGIGREVRTGDDVIGRDVG